MGNTTIDITMPSLGSDMRDGTLVEWQVAEGDSVNKGDIIAVIETNKGAIDMECYHTGTISQLLVQPVVSLPVGTVLARLEVDSEVADIRDVQSTELLDHASESKTDTETEADQPAQPQLSQPMPPQGTIPISERQKPVTRALTSPIVKKLAHEKQWDLSAIKGSGPDGAILLRDIQRLIKKTAPEPDTVTELGIVSAQAPATTPAFGDRNLPSIRESIASAMEKSKREIPHYYLSLDIELTEAVRWLQDKNNKRDPEDRILLLAMLLKATALALAKFPALNGVFKQNHFEPGRGIHIGNTISLRNGGLVIPAIHDVDQLSLNETMQMLRDITTRSRSGHLRSSELTDATITVTSIGDRGSDSVFGVIYPPQVAIIGFGRLRKSAVIKDDKIIIGDILTITLSADHRVSDGTLGAKFLHTLANQLQKPESL
ncbi:dihydrolipoamide acetyltransferase family protein [uncultured Photobacterium sp.]|uniref:dihydrolipoamide acetyltransferase family protein n=1 Tax=uncultured Photobacterium sp. TaxID=173973 RepID=UPI00260A3328|nr:dihydrolipoamide acetyltransferase family protein [uncultured Photobacterium sp.]